MRKIGFTGTNRGMTQGQKEQLRDHLAGLLRRMVEAEPECCIEFHHGDCIGADDEAATIAHEVGFWVIAHPGYPKGKEDDTTFRAFNPHSGQILESKEFIERDHDIVNAVDYMIAAPHSDREMIRSGTWTTVRYARKVRKPIGFVFPNRRMISDAQLVKSN